MQKVILSSSQALAVCANLCFLLYIEQEYVDSGSAHAVNTAMAMLALLYSGQVRLILMLLLFFFASLIYHINIIMISKFLYVYEHISALDVGSSMQIEHDPTPLYRAAKELINMHMDTGEFPQQVNIEFDFIMS